MLRARGLLTQSIHTVWQSSTSRNAMVTYETSVFVLLGEHGDGAIGAIRPFNFNF